MPVSKPARFGKQVKQTQVLSGQPESKRSVELVVSIYMWCRRGRDTLPVNCQERLERYLGPRQGPSLEGIEYLLSVDAKRRKKGVIGDQEDY
eukprot:856004-Pelagomonas_calceolata.AAC.5